MAVSYASGSNAGMISTNSDYDFAGMIKNLRAIEEMPARKLLKWKADWELRVTGFKDIKGALTSLSDSLAKMNSVDKFLVKSATSSNESVVKATATTGAQNGDYRIDVNQLARNAIQAYSSPGLNSKDVVINDTGVDQAFTYTYAGKTITVDVASGTTLNGFVNMINNDPTNPGVRAMLIQDGNSFSFQLRGMDLGASNTLTVDSTSIHTNDWGIDFGVLGNWAAQAPQDAEFKVNGWPATGYLTSSNNSVDGVIEGVTLNLRSIGASEVVISDDTEAMKENIIGFIDAYNTFKNKYMELTKVDATKKTYDPDYTDSLFDMQSGGVLTGNYVVQLIGSELGQVLSSSAIGFINNLNTPDSRDNFYDQFSTLSSLGIVMDSDKDSTTFGLLIFDEKMDLYGGQHPLDRALSQDPMAVAELFAARNIGNTNTSDFSFVNSIVGITKAGSYGVSYDIEDDGSGNHIITNAYIDGKLAKVEGHRITAIDSSSGSSGLVIEINNMQLGTYGSSDGNAVFIKQGKINQLYEAISFSETKVDPVSGESVYYKGAIGRLEDLIKQYVGGSDDPKNQGIIGNIEKKVDQEMQRLEVWQRFMVNKFARLEATLNQYNSIQKQLEAQVKQLGSSSS